MESVQERRPSFKHFVNKMTIKNSPNTLLQTPGNRQGRSLGDVFEFLGTGRYYPKSVSNECLGSGKRRESSVSSSGDLTGNNPHRKKSLKGLGTMALFNVRSRRGSSLPNDLSAKTFDKSRRGTFQGLVRMAKRRSDADTSRINLTMVSMPTVEKEPNERLMFKLRKWAKISMFCHQILQKQIKQNIENPAYHQQMEHISKLQESSEDTGLLNNKRFNPDYFKADKLMRMSQEGRKCLTKPIAERSETELHHTTLALRNVKIVADYSLPIQKAFARVGFFESYEPQRFIVKQGHPPANYYIIIYGEVLIVRQDENGGAAKNLTTLKRGDDFGELGIYHNQKRQGSIITQSYTEVLRVDADKDFGGGASILLVKRQCLSKDIVGLYSKLHYGFPFHQPVDVLDFKNIVMGGTNRQDPANDPLIKNQFFFNDWPIGILKDHPKQFIISYVQRNTVMEFDSRRSDWIYIVKSGSLRVLKKLVKTPPTINKRTGCFIFKAHTDAYKAFQGNVTDFTRHARYNRLEIPSPLSFENEDKGDNCVHPNSLPLVERLSSFFRPHTAAPQSSPKELKFKEITTPKKVTPKSALIVKRRMTSTPRKRVRKNTENRPKGFQDDKFSTKQTSKETKEKNEGRRTIFDDWDATYRLGEHEETEADRNPEFVQIQTLKKGEVFGLQYVVFDDVPQPSLIVVSNGADCIRISRRLFQQHLPKEMGAKEKLRTQVSPYPTDEELQEQLVTRVNWEAFKDIRLAQQISNKRRASSRLSFG